MTPRLSSRSKWISIPYKNIDPGHIIERATRVPINVSHEFLMEDTEDEISEWVLWFHDRGVPFAVIRLADGRWGMWKHRFTYGSFCCHADA